MARAAGREMTECRLLEESGRRHFMTRRFDRTAYGGKLHMQSLGALAHLDFNAAGAHSYEQAFEVMKRLALPPDVREQQFRRMLFNVTARNQDDHVKNIAFLMDKEGRWTLAPAFDVTFSYNPAGTWTASHQMTINGRRDGFVREDFRECARVAGLKRGRSDRLLDEVSAVVADWRRNAAEAGVSAGWQDRIASVLQLQFDRPQSRSPAVAQPTLAQRGPPVRRNRKTSPGRDIGPGRRTGPRSRRHK